MRVNFHNFHIVFFSYIPTCLHTFDVSGVTPNFVLGGLNILWGAKHTFCPIFGANLGFLLISIRNIGGAKAP